jgi:TonB family protein
VFERIATAIAAQVGDVRALTRRLENPRLYGVWAAVFLLHAAAIWALATNLAVPGRAREDGEELEIALTATGSPAPAKFDPMPEPQMQAAVSSDIQAPDIETQAPAPAAVPGLSLAAVLPPRPDPMSRNVDPVLPSAFAQIATPIQVMLTILVAADGSVSDVRVAQSSGQLVLDQLAEAFAKANWRFRAATQNGKPVADWTTVLVRFASSG